MSTDPVYIVRDFVCLSAWPSGVPGIPRQGGGGGGKRGSEGTKPERAKRARGGGGGGGGGGCGRGFPLSHGRELFYFDACDRTISCIPYYLWYISLI